MHQKYFTITVLVASLAGLMGEAQAADTDAPPNTAKVRVFQGGDITLYPGEFCYGMKNKSAIHAATSGFGIFNTHKRAGMPQTDDIDLPYNEYVITAGMPVAVMLQWEGERDGVKTNCGPTGSTFLPEPGKNYDIAMVSAGSCFLQIRELYETSPGKAFARQTIVNPSYSCN